MMARHNNLKGVVSKVGMSSTLVEKRSFAKWRPTVALEWDDTQQKVVAQKMQVGLSWRHLSTSSPSPTYYHERTGLADAFEVPTGLFELKDLKNVLSVEVWKTYLSESERQCLSRYLPKEINGEAVVSSLLNGENFCFENPLDAWSALLCDGAMHPDVVIARDFEFRLNRKAYTRELQSYHGNILQQSHKLEAIWRARRDSGREIERWVKKLSIYKQPIASRLPVDAQWVSSNKAAHSGGGEEDSQHDEGGSENTGSRQDSRQSWKRRKVSGPQHAVRQADDAAYVALSEGSRGNSVGSMRGPGTCEKLTEEVGIVKVNRELFASILRKKEAGEELSLELLQGVVRTTTSMARPCSDALQYHWKMGVMKELPLAHALFLKRKVQHAGRALLVAQLCVHRLPLVLFPNSLSKGHLGSDREGSLHGGKEAEPLDRKAVEQQVNTAVCTKSAAEGSGSLEPLAVVDAPHSGAFEQCNYTRGHIKMTGTSEEHLMVQGRHTVSQPSAQQGLDSCGSRTSKREEESSWKPILAHDSREHESVIVPEDYDVPAMQQIQANASPDLQERSSMQRRESAAKVYDTIHVMKGASKWEDKQGVAAMGPVRGGLWREDSGQANALDMKFHSPPSRECFPDAGALVVQDSTRLLAGGMVHPEYRRGGANQNRLQHSDDYLHLHGPSFVASQPNGMHCELIPHHFSEGKVAGVHPDYRSSETKDRLRHSNEDLHLHSLSSKSSQCNGNRCQLSQEDLCEGQCSGREISALLPPFSVQACESQTKFNLPSDNHSTRLSFADNGMTRQPICEPKVIQRSCQSATALVHTPNQEQVSYKFAVPAKQELHLGQGHCQQHRHQLELNALHQGAGHLTPASEHHMLRPPLFPSSISPPALLSEMVPFWPPQPPKWTSTMPDAGRIPGSWNNSVLGGGGFSEACGNPAVTTAFQRAPSDSREVTGSLSQWEQQQQTGTDCVAGKPEALENGTYRAFPGWDPMPAIAACHALPSLSEQGQSNIASWSPGRYHSSQATLVGPVTAVLQQRPNLQHSREEIQVRGGQLHPWGKMNWQHI